MRRWYGDWSRTLALAFAFRVRLRLHGSLLALVRSEHQGGALAVRPGIFSGFWGSRLLPGHGSQRQAHEHNQPRGGQRAHRKGSHWMTSRSVHSLTTLYLVINP